MAPRLERVAAAPHARVDGPGPRGAPDVGREEGAPARVEGEPVGPHADRHLGDLVLGSRPEDADGVLTPVRGERPARFVRDQYAGHGGETIDGADEHLSLAIDDVHRVVGGVGDVEPARALVNRRVIEAARPGVGRQVDVAAPLKPYGAPPRSCAGRRRTGHRTWGTPTRASGDRRW